METAIEPARLLYGNSRAVLLAEPSALAVGYVVTPDGRLVIGCRADAGDSTPWTLCVPEESEGATQVLGEPVRIDPKVDGAADRWEARHGALRERQVFSIKVESVRCGGTVWDASDVRLENPIAEGEAGILRTLNADTATLVAICERASGVSPERATAVGVDAWGLWIRGAIGPIRVEFAKAVQDTEGAVRAVAELVRGAKR